MPGAAASGGLTAPRIPAATQRPRPAGQSKSGAQSGCGHARGKPIVHRRGADRSGRGHDSRDAPRHIGRLSRPRPSVRYRRSQPTPSAAQLPSAPGTTSQQAFINQVAPGAVAAQHTYGVPAAVTIAQAIDESAWGQSTLADQGQQPVRDQGKRAGGQRLPAHAGVPERAVGDDHRPFRVYDNIAESIDDHGKLLATSGYYTAAMAASNAPNGFAQALTGVYATDPNYGTNLISLMRRLQPLPFRPGGTVRPGAGRRGGPLPGHSAPATQAPAAQAPAPQSPATSPPPLRQRPPSRQPRPAARPPPAAGSARGTARARTPRPAASPASSTAPDARTRLARSGPAHVHADGPRARAASASQPASAPAQPPASQPPSAATQRPATPVPTSPAQPSPTAPAAPDCRPVVQRAASVRDAAAGRHRRRSRARVRRLRGRGGDPGPSGHPRRSGAAREHVRRIHPLGCRSSSDTRVVTELAAVFWPMAPAHRQASAATAHAGRYPVTSRPDPPWSTSRPPPRPLTSWLTGPPSARRRPPPTRTPAGVRLRSLASPTRPARGTGRRRRRPSGRRGRQGPQGRRLGTSRRCRPRSRTRSSPRPGSRWPAPSLSTGTWPAPAESRGSCWPRATGCSARLTRAIRRSRARSWAPSTRTAPCSGPSPRR